MPRSAAKPRDVEDVRAIAEWLKPDYLLPDGRQVLGELAAKPNA